MYSFVPENMRVLIEAACKYERLVSQITAHRPDLDAGDIKGHIQQLAETTAHSQHDWVQSCLRRARAGEPMHWEARAGWEEGPVL